MSDTTHTRFAHRRLDAFRVALELFKGVEVLSAELPRGYADHKDQLRRAAAAVARNIAEGANRTHARDKASRFTVARGECGECDASLEMIELLDIVDRFEVRRLRRLADRIGAMLLGLIRRERSRASP